LNNCTALTYHSTRYSTQRPMAGELQIYPWPRVTSTFDLLSPTLTISCPCPVQLVCQCHQCASKSVHSFSEYHVVTNELTDEWTSREDNASHPPLHVPHSSLPSTCHRAPSRPRVAELLPSTCHRDSNNCSVYVMCRRMQHLHLWFIEVKNQQN